MNKKIKSTLIKSGIFFSVIFAATTLLSSTIQLIFDYSVGKPKQDFGIEMENEDNTITGITVEIVNPELKDIKETYSNYNEYITAVERGEINKEDKVLIGDFKDKNLEV